MMMQRKTWLMGILSLMLVFGLMFLGGCQQEPDPEPAPAEYTVTFDADGGTPASTTKKVSSGKTVDALPADPTKTDFGFDGWYTEKNGGGTSFIAATAVTADITVYAKWKAPTSVNPMYTVTFDADGGTPASTAKQVNSGETLDALPAAPTKAGFEFDGWYTEKNGGGTSFTAAASVTANITVYAKWKAANPFIGGVWMDWDTVLNYKFIEDNGAKVYYTATATNEDGDLVATNTFNVTGTYEYSTTELILRPEGGSPEILSYEITKSLLILEKGNDKEAWYTKNPETGGGFNGAPGPAPIGGMWQNIAPGEEGDTMGFNKDGEYFVTDVQKNRDGRYWWSVVGTYEYNTDRKELTLWHNGMGEDFRRTIFTVEFTTANQVMKLTEQGEREGEISTFNKRDNL
jgi:uncharacterized repeat protein (TIGR02543 family)